MAQRLKGEKIIIHHIYGRIYHIFITNFARILYHHTNYLQSYHYDYWMSKKFINILKEKLNIVDPLFTYYPICSFIKENKEDKINYIQEKEEELKEKKLEQKEKRLNPKEEELEEKELKRINWELKKKN